MGISLKEKREQKRINEILDAAQEVFLEKGYYGATLNDIAERALVSKSTVYQYFDGKEYILSSILSRGYEILTNYASNRIKDISDTRLRLFTLIHAEFEFFEKRKEFFEMLLVEKLDFENGTKNGFHPSYQEHLNFLEDEIRSSIVHGFFRDIDTEDAAYMIFAILRAFALRWLFQGFRGRLTDRSINAYDLIMKGLAETTGQKNG